MRQYRDPESKELKKLSANQFMDVWSHYDKDGKQIYKLYFFFGEIRLMSLKCIFLCAPFSKSHILILQ